MKLSIYRYSSNIKRLLILLAVILIIALLWYSQNIVDRLRKDSKDLVSFYADISVKAVTEYQAEDFSFIFDQIIRKISIPMIISEKIDENPTAWKGVGIDQDSLTTAEQARLEEMMHAMDQANEPIPLKYKDVIFGYIHYGDTELIRRLKMLPYIEIAVVTLFIFLGYIGFQLIRSSEKRSIWVGMAKETAHQLGTPLSSLLGWSEVLKTELGENENIREMIKDLERLKKVANRFSKIGSRPKLTQTALNPVIEEAVNYYRRRLPQFGQEVSLIFKPEKEYFVKINADLFSWAIENLIKNALDAVPDQNGYVVLRTRRIDPGIAIDVEDNGKGIPKKDRKNIFRPGFSSKKRGWGLGLSLSKRIIADYHNGKIMVLESKSFTKTILRIILKKSTD